MGIRWTRHLLATIAVTGGILGIAQLPANAALAATPRVTIVVQAPYALNNLTFVAYSSGHTSARVYGTVFSATSGEVLKLYGQQFPYSKPAAPVGAPLTIGQTGDVGYSFRHVTPALATRYRVELFADGTTTTPLATSKVSIIYVVKGMSITETHRCPRPDCTSVVHVKVFLPPQVMRAERAKKLDTYFAVNLSPSHIPPPPGMLRLGAGHPRVTRSRKISAGEYGFSVTFTFRIGNDAAHWGFRFCAKDTVATDGLGLPGRHACGRRTIIAALYYLG
jgi:hypothetical protein